MEKDELVEEVIKCIEGLKNRYKADKDIINEYEERILNINSAKLSSFFVTNMKGANIDAHGKVILESKELVYIYEYVKYVKFFMGQRDIDIEPFRKVILESNHPWYNFYLSKFIFDHLDSKIYYGLFEDGDERRKKDLKNLQKHAYAIAKSDNEEYNFKFIELILSHMHILECLSIDINDNRDVVIKNKNLEYNYLLAYNSNLGLYDAEKHVEVITESKKLEYNYKGARYFESEYAKKCLDVILESKNLEYNYLCARYCTHADVLAHGKVIIDSKDCKYNQLFLDHVESCDRAAHARVIKEASRLRSGPNMKEIEEHLNDILNKQKVKQY